MAHHTITIIGTEELYEKAREILLRRENPEYYEDIDNGMSKIDAAYKWGDGFDIGGSDWVGHIDGIWHTVNGFVDEHKYWFKDVHEWEEHMVLDVRNIETEPDSVDLVTLNGFEFTDFFSKLPQETTIMTADSHW